MTQTNHQPDTPIACSACSGAKDNCTSTKRQCGACCGSECRKVGELTLTPVEVWLMNHFAVLPFLPLAGALPETFRELSNLDPLPPLPPESPDYYPIYRPSPDPKNPCPGSRTTISLCLLAMFQKNLISLDYDIPLKGCTYTSYQGLHCYGSMALTQFGQDILDTLELQAKEPEEPNPFSRTELLLGHSAMKKLAQSRVAVFGIGGVGGHVVEALARSGIGQLDLIDNDVVAFSNLNRQIIATRSTIGRPKVEVAAERIRDINPKATIHTYKTFYLPENADFFDFSQYDYIVDAIDTVAGKLSLAVKAKEAGVPIISSMGAGNKLDPTAFEVADIYDTSVCPLAKAMRHELRRRGVDALKVVYSKEPPMTPREDVDPSCKEENAPGKRQTPGSIAFVPSVVGLIIAGEVIKDLSK